MSDPYASFTFLPWVRQGMARYLDTEDQGQDNDPASVTMPVTLRVNDFDPINKDLALMGPGDVTGLEAAQIIRREPERGSRSFSPNQFPFVEFRSPDLPWIFTPLRPDNKGRLRPWLCLVVVREREGVQLSTGGRESMSQLSIGAPALPADELPPLEDSWAWAHSQVTRRADDTRPLKRIMAESPELAVSRLICPRQLTPLTSYHACVVPAFKVGVASGLGLPPVDDLSPAWANNSVSVTLPVYYSWDFTTGAAGDFEALVRLLKPAPVPDGIGRREVDVADPHWSDPKDFGVPDPVGDNGPVSIFAAFEGALRAPDQTREPLPAPLPKPYSDRLAKILTQAESEAGDDPDPIVAPPVYGRWHAEYETFDGARQWIGDLNLDPRDRAAAGMGAEAVRMNQEALMHAAWTQVDRITQDNNRLRRGKMAEAVGRAFKSQNLDPMTPAELVSMTFPIHAQVLMSPITLREKIARSQLPKRAASPTLRRILRADGPMARAAGRPDLADMLPAMAVGNLQAAPVHEGFADTATGASLAKSILRSPFERWLYKLLHGRLQLAAALAIVMALLALALPGALVTGALAAAITGAVAAFGLVRRLHWQRFETVQTGGLTPEALAATQPPSGFAVQLDRVAGLPDVAAPLAARHIEEFRTAAIARRRTVLDTVPTPSQPPPLVMEETHRTLLLRLDPTKLAVQRFAGQVVRPAGPAPEDPLDEIMVYPEIDMPMYLALREQNQDYVLPGLQTLPTNSITLVEANRRFVEAFLVGANHEMARELRWREYPTDQRGSYFRQFWDPRGTGVSEESDREDLYDVKKLTTWSSTEPLGRAGLPEGRNPERLVLLIRGELLRRFPSAQIYAQKARFETSGERVLDTEIRHPVFRGTLEPDVHFMGFTFDQTEAIGSTDPQDNDPGWFFVIQQQPTEPRFGLDVATLFKPDLQNLASWDDLTWGHFADSAQDLAGITHLRPDLVPAGVGPIGPASIVWGHDSAGLARAILQKPVRIAIHADDMLPEGT